MSRLTAVLTQRCPHCRQGRVFASLWRMYETCPVCAIKYEREDGYFMMSVFVGYVMCLLLAVPICLVLYFNGAPIVTYIWVNTLAFFLFSPLIFRYARVVWMHIDEVLDPR